MFDKFFTLEEAQKTLPLVKQIVADILQKASEISQKKEYLRGSEKGRKELESIIFEMEDLMAELEDLGCFYKDWNFEVGLVDFPAVIDDKTVFLCWRSDEEEIEWYHPVQGGYRDRKRIPSKYLLHNKASL